MATTGERIREARERADLTQRQLASAVGRATQTVSRWERDERRPDVDEVAAIASALGITPAELYGVPVARMTARIAGGEVTGPADLVQRVLQGLADPQPSSPEDIIASGIRPNPRHAGLHKLIDAIDDGTYMERFGLALTPEDEAALRTYGRSGPPVATTSEALRVVASIQNARRPAPREEDIEPGVKALLEDERRALSHVSSSSCVDIPHPATSHRYYSGGFSLSALTCARSAR